MAADMKLHVFADGELTETDFQDFESNTLGSKWFDPRPASDKRWDRAYDKFSRIPGVWIGEVSWLKAALFEDNDTYVPDPVGTVSDIVGEDWPVVDDEFIAKIGVALGRDNKTGYSTSTADVVIEFLETNKGKRAFTVSW